MTPLLPILFELGKTIIDRVVPDEGKKAEAHLELLKMTSTQDFALILEQIKVNAAEAQNPNPWVSGWRPGAGWCCVAGLAYTFLLQPLLSWGSSIWGFHTPPSIDTEYLMYLLGAMLGIGGLRTVEKVKGVTK